MNTRKCEQRCEKTAEVYAIDPAPNGWGGHYCEEHARRLGFKVVDHYGLKTEGASK